MRKLILLILTYVCLAQCVKAQYVPVSLPLGIDATGVDKNTVKEPTKNVDAKRFLEKAVKEDPDNLEKIGKLLDAGASAYVSYEMIDKKQYELMDLMYKRNPKLIRYSQMLHYACAHCSDTAMIDFLIEHGASLDLCGNYWEKRGAEDLLHHLCIQPYSWNNDARYYFTPQDVAYRHGNKTILNYIIRKYGKFPTTIGLADYIYKNLANDKKVEHLICLLNGEDDFYYLINKGNGSDSKNLAQLLNTELPSNVHWNSRSVVHCYILCRAIERLGVYRNGDNTEKAAQYETLVRLMIDKGARVNVNERIVTAINPTQVSGCFNSPILAAMKKHNMMDIIKLLRAKGAPIKVQYLERYNTLRERSITDEAIMDEYKEAIFLGDI